MRLLLGSCVQPSLSRAGVIFSLKSNLTIQRHFLHGFPSLRPGAWAYPRLALACTTPPANRRPQSQVPDSATGAPNADFSASAARCLPFVRILPQIYLDFAAAIALRVLALT